jgi:hypothetical protein
MNYRKITYFVASIALSSFALACSDDADETNMNPDSGGSSAGANDAPSGAGGMGGAEAGGAEAGGAGGMGGAEAGGAEAGGAGGMGGAEALDPQVPPNDAARMAEWLDAFESNGWAEDWVCEADFTEKDEGAAAIHVHGANRVCNNQALAAATLEGDAELPVGAAALKYVERGIYVEVKVDAESDGGKGWFWYAPNGEAAGVGLAGCTGCHSAAGADDDHPGLGDYVYFQVK